MMPWNRSIPLCCIHVYCHVINFLLQQSHQRHSDVWRSGLYEDSSWSDGALNIPSPRKWTGPAWFQPISGSNGRSVLCQRHLLLSASTLFVVNFHFEFTIEHALTIMAYTDPSVRGSISPWLHVLAAIPPSVWNARHLDACHDYALTIDWML